MKALARVLNRGLRLPAHRTTTAHLCSAYPFAAEGGLGSSGVYLGTNVLTGGAGFAFDPFTAYSSGLVTNPNMLVAGEPGTGKSAAVKCFLYRSAGVARRWIAIVDPKGEYGELAERLGLDVIALRPGGRARINPLDPGPGGVAELDEVVRRNTDVTAALVASVLRRDLSPIEDAAIGWACLELARSSFRTATLVDLAALLAEPTEAMAGRARLTPAQLGREVEAVTFGLGKLIDRSLRGMVDGPTNVALDWSGPGIVLDLSAIHHDPDALTVVMVCATAWLQAVLSRADGPPRLQVIDEAWSLLAAEKTSRYLQAAWKLGRSYGVANLAVVHRLSDLRAQADDGTATAKVAAGLLADTQTRVLFRQSPDQIGEATSMLGLTTTESEVLSRLGRGRAIWKFGSRTAVVQHVIGRAETFCDTDARMVAT